MAPIRPLLPTFTAAPTADPGDVVAGSATVLGPGKLRVTLQNPATVSRLPNAMAVWESTELYDTLVRSLVDADLVDIGDIQLATVWAGDTAAPTDVVITFGVSAGAVNATNTGAACRIQANAGAWRVQHAVNTGAGWAYTQATATNTLTLGAALQLLIGTALTQARVSAYGLDGTIEPVRDANGATAPTTSAIGADFDRVFIGVGWATGAGGSPVTIDIGCSALLLRPRQVPAILPFAEHVATAWPTTIRRIAVLGHSMADGQGTIADDTYAGVAVQSGWTWRSNGVTSATWPAGVNPGVGLCPWAVADAIARGATDGTRWICRRSTPGIAIGANPDNLLALLRDDVTLLGGGDPDVVMVWLGANDAQSAAELAAYSAHNGILRLLQLVRREFPAAAIVALGERTSDAGTYPYVADGSIDAAKQAAVAQIPYSVWVSATSPTPIGLVDTVHPSAGAAGGYRTMAERAIPAALGL